MVRVKPFKGLRPQPHLAKAVAALPYDVMNRAEAKAMAAGNPLSFLHVSRAEIDFPDTVGEYDESVYEGARANLLRFVKEETLVMEKKPVYYVYRETMGKAVQTGLVAAVAVADYENGAVMKHELTRKEKEEDRIRHFDICNCHTEPVFLTYRRQADIDAIIENWIGKHQPLCDFVSEDDIGHTLWVLDDEATITALSTFFLQMDKIYIADGHHRTASAAAIGKLRRSGEINDREAPYESFLAVIFPDSDLTIMAYNRIVRRPEEKKAEDILSYLQEKFALERVDEDTFYPAKKHEFGVYLDEQWYKVIIPQNYYASSDAAANLDAAILQREVFEPLFAIADMRRDKRIDFIGGIRGNEEIERRCRQEDSIGFALYPVEISDLMAIADAGKIMPPKSTWFEPKLRSGLFLHYLEEEIKE